MKSLVLVAALALAAAACGPRAVEVRSSPSATAQVALRVTNNHSQAVNVYVTSAGNDIFVRQLAAGATETVPVAGVAVGSTVTLKATAVDASRTWSKPNVVLSSTTQWQVP
jgi:hypothetical protein